MFQSSNIIPDWIQLKLINMTLPYTTIGNGPAVVLIHGAFECAASHKDLADALSKHFTCVLYSRRGRLDSPPHPADYSMATEVGDVRALMAVTGAQLLFGVSSGALIALETVRALEASGEKDKVKKLAVYEPALKIKDNVDISGVAQYNAEIAAGREDKAMISAMFITQMGPSVFNYVPRGLLEWLVRKGMEKEEKAKKAETAKPKGKEEVKDDKLKMPTLREYAPTIGFDFQLVQELADSLDNYKTLVTPVLIMGGDRSPAYLKTGVQELEKVIPNHKRVELKGCDHGKCLITCYVFKIF